MLQYIRINELYITITKAIKNYVTTTINVKLCSEKAAKAAYGGMKYSIDNILKGFREIYLEEYTQHKDCKLFSLKRRIGRTIITVFQPDENNMIKIVINNNMFVY